MEYFYNLIIFLTNHPLATFCGLSAFIISCWTGYVEQKSIYDTLMSSVVSVFSALSILDLLFKRSQNHLWLPLIGIVVGFIGPHRLRNTILVLWDWYVMIIKEYISRKLR
ncbi:hypothetical protein [Klebsiella pasteurii]|uniref:hypothetical protein n=1 Tax=Klebsiella pasteurii TaxID=2587529 RepID=UPI00292DB1B1|nr:hypothetical protein [Klebsiella pasteurii]